jgi:hypothetical protein
MSNISNKILNRMFRKIEGLVWDLQSNQVGIQDKDGIHTLVITPASEGQEASYGVSINPFDTFGFAIPAFAQNTPLNQIEVGDIIIGSTEALGWVIDVRNSSLLLRDKNGMTKNYTPPKTAIMGVEGALVVKSLTGLFGNNGAAGLQNSLLPLLMLQDGGNGLGDIEDLLPMILLGQQQAGDNANAAANFLPTLLMTKALKGGNGAGGLSDVLPLLMLTGGSFGGGDAGGLNSMLPFLLMDKLGGDSATLVGQPALRPGLPSLTPGVPGLTRL